tara:strand:- start:325 stop:939 length:615 start_codon:yes stop_codon:yes gene_type:complete
MMPLFENLIDPSINHLPYDGCVHYWGKVFSQPEAFQHYEALLKDIAWKHDEAIVFGKHIVTKRKVAWYADKSYQYSYSNIHRTALLWTPHVLALKAIVEAQTLQTYNSCLLNFYPSGTEGMAWHSDDERELIESGSIASLSFGATRKFAMKHKVSKERLVFELESGDLIEMKGETQRHWLHNIPTTTKVAHPRINLTFRQMKDS